MSFFSSLNKSSTIKPSVQVRRVAAPAKKQSTPHSNGVESKAPSVQPTVSKASTPKPSVAKPSQKLVAPRTEKPHRKSPVSDKSRASAVRNGTKRKSNSPSIQFGSSSEGESEDEPQSVAAKKTKLVPDPEPDTQRKLRDVTEYTDGGVFPLIHGADLTSAPEAKGYAKAFKDSEEILEISLEYPSTSNPERFQLVFPTNDVEGYHPLSDIIDTVEQVLTHYISPSISTPLLDSSTGLPYRLRRAYNHQSSADFLAAVEQYNDLIRTTRAQQPDPRLPLPLQPTPQTTAGRPPMPLITHILSQTYARTVSPHVETLRRYRNGEDNVYGELLAPLTSQISTDTRLNSSSTILDLGSGVGNVVLQAALETGATAYGVEIMPNPCALAAAQRTEFHHRCRLWGLAPGPTTLWQGDFLDDARVAAVLRRADVVLVNNQAFNPELNAALVSLFLDVKEGARIVSLKSFVPGGWRLTARTMGNPISILKVREREYWSHGVSWTDGGGKYYVATKDSSVLERFQEGLRRGGG